MYIHLLSPLLYMVFVKIIVLIPTCKDSTIMKSMRKVHNIILSLLSLIMLIGITYSTYISGKFNSINSLLCNPYDNSIITIISTKLFLYSKYLEWGDTLFLHLSNKPISMLQYTHHMTTAFLVYLNSLDYLSPTYFIVMGANCFVHIFMYWYFAYPNGIMKKARIFITQSQIIQHILVILTAIYTLCIDNCKQNKYGNYCGLLFYIMYLFYFSLFYLKSYINKIK